MPSARNMATLRRSSSNASTRSKPADRSSQTVDSLKSRAIVVVAPGPHDQQIPPDAVPAEPGLGQVMDPVRAGGQQHDLEIGVEQVEQRLHLFDDRILTTGVEERAPVLAGRLEIVLARRGVRKHAVDVDNHRTSGRDRPVAPSPMFLDVPQQPVASLSVRHACARRAGESVVIRRRK